MKKRNTKKTASGKLSQETQNRVKKASTQGRLTIGLDLGDRYSDLCILDAEGEVLVRAQTPTTPSGMKAMFGKLPKSGVALEVGTHSPWVSRQLRAMGHKTIVANPRTVAWITKSRKKDDQLDAEKLARLARADEQLLSPIRHRGEESQHGLMMVRARAAAVKARTQLINTVRGLVKSTGQRLAGCDADKVSVALAERLDEAAKAAVTPLLESVEMLTKQIHGYDAGLEAMKDKYPEAKLLTAVYGVGTIVALTFLLTIDDPQRFGKSREVGAYLGLVPGRRESGQQAPEMRINKEGDRDLRTLLVQSAQCILRKGAPDSDLRRWGLAKLDLTPADQQSMAAGKRKTRKKQKKRVIVAVARRLAVLLHHLWVNGEVYDPLYGAKMKQHAEARARAKAQARSKAA